MYSLLSAPVLAVDLVRAPGGAAAAEVLLAALARDPDGCSASADTVDLPLAAARRRAREAVAAASSLDAVLTGVTGLFRAPGPDGLPGVDELRTAADLLAGTPIGRPDHLVALLHTQVLPGDPHLAAAAADAVLAALLPDALDARDRACLGAGWAAVTGEMPAVATLDGLPGAAAVRRVLDRCARLDADDLATLDAAHHGGPAGQGLTWSSTVHLACVAALDADLVRPLASAQVAAAHAVARAERGSRTVRVAAMPAVVGHLQAVALGPLLGADVAALLSGAWDALAA